MVTQTGNSPRSTARFSGLVHQIYEAAIFPERWPAVVGAVADSLGAGKGLLFTPYLAPQQGGMIFPHNISESTLQTWASHYIDHDIWARDLIAKELWLTGGVVVDEEMTPWPEFLASRFYQEFLSKIGIGRVCVGLVFGGESGLVHTTLPVFRSHDEPPFSEEDKQWLQLLVPHVSRSLGLMQRLDTARLQHASLLASFDRVNFGVVLMNEAMQVLHLNKAAQAVIERHDGIYVNAERRLECDMAASNLTRLSRWLLQAQEASAANQDHFLDGFIVVRQQEQRQYMVQYSQIPASAEWSAAGSTVRYVAFVTDPAALQLPTPERLIELYGLTQAQAKVALALASGATYKQVASKLAVSEETVRSHVKEIYPKTRVNRQADLVRLVLALAHTAV